MTEKNNKADKHFEGNNPEWEERNKKRRIRRKKNKEKRLVFSLIVGLILLILLFFLWKSFFGKKDDFSLNNPKGEAGQNISRDDNSNLSSEEVVTQSESDDSAANVAGQESLPENSPFSGSIQLNANTNGLIQDAKGKGKNHNQAANVYAYNVPDVKAAMYDGKKLAEGKIAFLTYDDGVSSESTPLLLDELNRLGVPATFFMLGKTFTEEHKPILQRMMKEGHALAYHSFNHDYSDLYPGRHADTDEILKQFKGCRDALTPLIGPDFVSNVWRYPGGHMSWKELDAADKALENEGVHWIDWNSLNSDAAGKGNMPTTTQGQVDEVLDSWRSFGSPDVICVLMHDTPAKELTRNSAEAIVNALRNEGFSFGILE